MKPRDELAVITAGTVIAETFELVGPDGSEYGSFDSTPPDFDPSIGSLNPRGALEFVHSPPAYLAEPGVTRPRRSTIEWSGPTENDGTDTVAKGPSELRLTSTRREDTYVDTASSVVLQDYDGPGYRSAGLNLGTIEATRQTNLQMLTDSTGAAVATLDASGAGGLAFVKVDGAADAVTLSAATVAVDGQISHPARPNSDAAWSFGVVAISTVSANQTLTAAVQFMTGLDPTYAFATGRRYRLAVKFDFQATVAGAQWLVELKTYPSGTTRGRFVIVAHAASTTQTYYAEVMASTMGADGDSQFAPTVERIAGTGTGLLVAAAGRTAQSYVEDMGTV